jgi:hypothetical protein
MAGYGHPELASGYLRVPGKLPRKQLIHFSGLDFRVEVMHISMHQPAVKKVYRDQIRARVRGSF